MSNAPAIFRQCDLQRAIRAAIKEGMDFRVRITKAGEIIIEPREGEATLDKSLDARPEFRL